MDRETAWTLPDGGGKAWATACCERAAVEAWVARNLAASHVDALSLNVPPTLMALLPQE